MSKKTIKIELAPDYNKRLGEASAKRLLEQGGGVVEHLDEIDALLLMVKDDENIEIEATKSDGTKLNKDLLYRLRYEMGLNVLSLDDGASLPRPRSVFIVWDEDWGHTEALFTNRADAENYCKVMNGNTVYDIEERLLDEHIGKVVEVFRANVNWPEGEVRDIKPVAQWAEVFGEAPSKFEVFGQNSNFAKRKVITGMSIISQEDARQAALRGREQYLATQSVTA